MAKVTDQELGRATKQTFYDLCAWLSRKRGYSEQQLKRLQNEDDYLALIKLASDYWLIGALTAQLRVKGVLAQLPEQLFDYLIYLESTYQQRAESLKNEVILVVELLQQQSINAVVIKGAANLFNGVANPISKRYMNDIDLLIPEAQYEQAQQVLKQAGYKADKIPFYLEPVYGHHAPALIRPDGLAYIELHRWPLKKIYTKVLTAQELWQRSVRLALSEHQIALQCSPTQQVILSIAHSELTNRGFVDKHLDLHQLYSLYEICCHYNDQIDWAEVVEHFERINAKQILESICVSMQQLFNLALPAIGTFTKQAQNHYEHCLDKFIANQNAGKMTLLFQRIKIIA